MRLHQKPPTSRNRLLQRHDLLNFVTTLYEGDLHAKRVLSLANATLGVLASASLAIHAVGRGLAQAMGTLTKHGVKQVDRLLSNRGVDVGTFFAYWTPYIGLCLPGRSEKIREGRKARRWLTWRRTLDGWGYSPLDERQMAEHVAQLVYLAPLHHPAN